MPYSSVSELPVAVRDKIKSPKKRRQWLHVFNSEYDKHYDESRAFASAWSVAQKAQKMQKAQKGQMMPGDNFNFFLPLAKVDAKTRTVSGYASTPALDLDGEIVSLDAIKKALPGYWEYRNVREMHTNSAVGVGKEANIDEKGLFLTAKIVDDAAWQKVVEGVYKGFSIGGRKLAKNGNVITEIDWIETSIVDRPANPECKFDVAKRAKDSASAYLLKSRIPRDAKTKALSKMAQAVEILAKESKEPPDVDEKLPNASDGVVRPAVIKTATCKAHGVAGCPDCMCKAHGAVDCEKCSVAKRKFSGKDRKRLVGSGAAMSDGSFPIANAKDLSNAHQAIGRAKNPAKAKAHIKNRAKALGLPNPFKESKKAAKLAEAVAVVSDLELTKSAPPSFLTLGADDGPSVVSPRGSVEGEIWSGHEPDFEQLPLRKDGPGGAKSKPKLAKRMSVAGSLSYCFDSIRDAQRSLLYEAKREGGDKKDAALAAQLGTVAKELAAVIGQKAEHEGAEAIDLTDADDNGLNLEDFSMSVKGAKNEDSLEKLLSQLAKAGRQPTRMQRLGLARGNLKKARKARDAAEEAIKSAHAMHKSAYLAKAAKKKPADDEEFDHAEAMSKLQKAYGELEKLGTFVKAANVQLKKAASRSGQPGQQPTDPEPGFFEVPMGLKELTPAEMATAGPGSKERGSEPPILRMTEPYPGKFAKGNRRLASVSAEVAQLLMEKAAAEAKVEVLERMPAVGNGRRPAAFDVSKLGLGDGSDSTSLFKGVTANSLASDDEETRKSAVGRVIGNMIQGGHGKSVFDPSFHGTAGAA